MERFWACRRRVAGGVFLFILGAAVAAFFVRSRSPIDEAELLRANQRIDALRGVNDSLRLELEQIRRDLTEDLSQRHAPEKGPVATGRRLPPLQAAGWLNGDMPPLASELRGKVAVIDIWAYW